MSALYIKDIKVVYGGAPAQVPSDAVLEIENKSNDINVGLQGKYVWPVPVVTDLEDEAITRIEITIQDDPDPNLSDLAKGSGGKYRYLQLYRQQNERKITSIILVRNNRSLTEPPEGYDSLTGDINEGRQGDYLYIASRKE